MAKINMVNNLPNNSLMAEFSYHGTSTTCISSTNSPDEIVIESPLFSLKPIASLTKASRFDFYSSLIFSNSTLFELITIFPTFSKEIKKQMVVKYMIHI